MAGGVSAGSVDASPLSEPAGGAGQVPDTVFELPVVDVHLTARCAEGGYDVGGRCGHRRGAGTGGAFADLGWQPEFAGCIGPGVDVRVGSGEAEGCEEADGRGAGVEEPGEVFVDEA